MAEIMSIDKLLEMDIDIPNYQRPYKWKIKNIQDLLIDIKTAIEEAGNYKNFKYRIGTIILHEREKDKFDVVDGQQRIISLILIKKCLDPEFDCSLLSKSFSNKITQSNIHNNYKFIREWFSFNDKDKYNKAFSDILEVVVIPVDKVSEAFQLFDSQNTRGKPLNPHDLLKAYHLREMRNDPYKMEHAVIKWESKDTRKISELFDLYLFPILYWSRGMKSKPFTEHEIDAYKGITESSTYSYAKRASKASPCFQITEPFIAGNDFFEMVDHYLNLLKDIKTEILRNKDFETIKSIICNGNEDISSVEELDSISYGSTGFSYTCNLFYCALLFYYDKFHNFDVMAVKKLCTWAFMLRIDMSRLGFDSINKYAVGEYPNNYSNTLPIFSIINQARLHTEISNLQIIIKQTEEWKDLSEKLKRIWNQ